MHLKEFRSGSGFGLGGYGSAGRGCRPFKLSTGRMGGLLTSSFICALVVLLKLFKPLNPVCSAVFTLLVLQCSTPIQAVALAIFVQLLLAVPCPCKEVGSHPIYACRLSVKSSKASWAVIHRLGASVTVMGNPEPHGWHVRACPT